MDRLTYNEPLREYEDNQGYIHDIYNKLQAYKQAEEQGLLLRLPCKVGDTVYIVGMLGCAVIEEWEIENIRLFLPYDKEFHFGAIMKRAKGTWCKFNYKDLGESVFLTREEAEAKLAELRGE